MCRSLSYKCVFVKIFSVAEEISSESIPVRKIWKKFEINQSQYIPLIISFPNNIIFCLITLREHYEHFFFLELQHFFSWNSFIVGYVHFCFKESIYSSSLFSVFSSHINGEYNVGFLYQCLYWHAQVSFTKTFFVLE